MAYSMLLVAHSLWRWVVVVAVVARLGRAVAARGEAFTKVDRLLGIGAIIALDVQLLLGLGLYCGLSPATSAAFADVGAAMKDPYMRFWLVEHGPVLLGTVVAGHVGNVRVRKAVTDAGKHKAAAIAYGVALLLILVAMPWPFRAIVGRPWVPGL